MNQNPFTIAKAIYSWHDGAHEYAETNVPAKKTPTRKSPRISKSYEHETRETRALTQAREGAEIHRREKDALIRHNARMLPKASRLRHERDFARLSVKGRPLYGPYCILRARKSGSVPSKIGFVASGKMFKKAVDRNRIRRRMRETIRPHLDDIPDGYDMSFVARKDIVDAKPKDLKESMLHLIKKMPAEVAKPLRKRPKPPKSRKGVIAYSKQMGTPRPPGKRQRDG